MTATRVDAALIRSIPLFSELSDEPARILAASASRHTFTERTILFREGDRPGNIYTVLHGAVELYTEDDDKKCTIAIIPAVRTFALPSILTGHASLSARILEPSELIAVPVTSVAEILRQDAGFASVAMRELARECDEVVEDFKSYRLRSTTERVAYWMLRSDSKSGDTGQILSLIHI